VELLQGATTCPDDGTALVQRDDDQPATVLSRLKVYYQKTAPLIEYYQTKGLLIAVDGTQYYKVLGEDIAQKLKAVQ
jgi:adenylate kinase